MMARIVDKRNLRNMTTHINRRILHGNEKLREGYRTAAESPFSMDCSTNWFRLMSCSMAYTAILLCKSGVGMSGNGRFSAPHPFFLMFTLSRRSSSFRSALTLRLSHAF